MEKKKVSKKRVYVLYRLVFTTYPGVRNAQFYRTLSGCVASVAVALRHNMFTGVASNPRVYRAVFDEFDTVSAFDGEDVTDIIFSSARSINSKLLKDEQGKD